MVFDKKMLSSVMRGVIRVEEEDDWFCFTRFLPGQADAYRKDPNLYMKVPATSGVSMAFRTDASKLSFHYRVTPASSRSFYDFTLLVNGKKYAQFGKKLHTDEGDCVFSLPEGEKEVEVFLPCLCKTELKDISVDGNVTALPKQPKLLFLGDSITQGYDSLCSADCYPTRVCAALGFEQLNQGIAAAKFDPDTIEWIPEFVPDRIVVAFGTNDWNQGVPHFRETVESYFARLHETFGETPVWAITPIWRADGDRVTAVGTFEDAIRIIEETCAAYPNLTVVDGGRIFPHDTTFLYDGRLHPSAEGFAFYAEGLLRAMEGAAPVKVIDGANRAETVSRVREASRGVILRDGKLLVSHDVAMDMLMTPGGGKEQGESDEACCAREVEEETGLVVRVGKEFLTLIEYYGDVRYVTHYFACEPTGTGEKHLTELEAERGLRPEWLAPEAFLDTVSKHADFAETNEEKRGLYLREFEAMKTFLGK